MGNVGKGVSTRKSDASECMVLGCARRALFKKGGSTSMGVVRGYCRLHRDHAMEHKSDTTKQSEASHVAARIEYIEGRSAHLSEGER